MNMAEFDHKSFKIGIAVGFGLKGKFSSPIDTQINAAFTKGIEIGQRLKNGVPLADSEGDPLTDSNGVRLIAKGGI